MNALAFELSTLRGSAALFRDEQLVAERSWEEARTRSQQLFHVIPQLLDEASLSLSAIETFFVGRGPGVYSGLRIALTAARSMALPGNRTVYTVSSGQALAAETIDREGNAPVAVVGDARRNMLWLGVFRIRGAHLETLSGWSIVERDRLASHLKEPCTVVSPDWERISDTLNALEGTGVRVVQEVRYPSARYVGRTGLLRSGAGVPSDPLTPIYSHPPVSAQGASRPIIDA